MCGIGGIWFPNGKPAAHRDLRRMMSAMRHRGPEGAAYARLDGGSLLLGFLRLGFTDGGTCQQPLFNEDHRIALVYNGEIYDYASARTSLRSRGHAFRTESDTEVIVHLYEEYGDDFHQHLNGEFSFVLWDGRRQELVLVRDRFGVKPLLYARHEGGWVFASEAKGILALPGFEAALDPAYHAGPGIGIAQNARTPFAGITSVRPGHVMRIGRHGVSERAYWRPHFGAATSTTRGESFDAAALAVRTDLERAVARRIEGDVPIALSLSSGLDSTIVCGIMAEQLRARGGAVAAFSLGYDGAHYDESAAAARTAAHFGARHVTVKCTIDDLANDFLEGIHATEVATNSLSSTARLRLTAAVRRAGFKALMSGEGSDELFGGYPYFGLEAIDREIEGGGAGAANARARRAEFVAREFRSRGIFWEPGSRSDDGSDLYGHASTYGLRVSRADRFGKWLFSREWRSAMKLATPRRSAGEELDLAWLRTLSPFDASRVVARSVLGSLVIPALGDRVEMANSLEGRVPYLDLDVIERAYSLPESFCIETGTFARKRVLRRAFADRLPANFDPPRKHTLMAPTFRELAGTKMGRDLVATLLSDSAIRRVGIFDPWLVRGLRAMWARWPARAPQAALVDNTVGYILSTQAMHHVHVEDALGHRRTPTLIALDEDRSPVLDGDRLPMVHA